MAYSSGTPFFLPPTAAQGKANYPHARIANTTTNTLYVSGTSSRRGDNTYAGCTTNDDGTHVLDVAEQTRHVLQNIRTIIQGATDGKHGLESVVDATVFLTDMNDYQRMNEVWNSFWTDRAGAPSRTCVQVSALPNERINVEIKCTALISK
jgi:2-aminomuconate deaminase